MMRVMAAFAAAMALIACSNAAQRTAEEFPVVAAPNYDADIGPDRAAGIASAIAFNTDAVRAAAPNYVVAEVQDQVEGQPFTAITLSAGDEEVFRLLPTHDAAHVHAVVTRSTQARGPNGEIVGVATFAQASAADAAFCLEEYTGSGEFACSTDEAGRFWRVYEAGALRRADAKLVEMRWIAPRAVEQ